MQQLMKFTPYEVNYDNVGWHNVIYPKSTLYQNTTGSADNTIEREDSESTIEECDVDEECNAEEVYKEKRSSCQMYIFIQEDAMNIAIASVGIGNVMKVGGVIHIQVSGVVSKR